MKNKFKVYEGGLLFQELDPKENPNAKYRPYIVAWGKLKGWPQEFIDKIVAKAINQKAPLHAIRQDMQGEWLTLDDVRSVIKKRKLNDYVNKHFPDFKF